MYATLSKTVELGRYKKVKITFKVTHSLSSLISLFNTSRDFLWVFHSSDSWTYLHRFTHSHFNLNFHAIHRFILCYLQLVSLLCWMLFVNLYQSLVQFDWFETDSNSPQPAPIAGVVVWCCSLPQGPTDSWRNDDIITIYRHTHHAIFSTHLLPNTFHQQQYIHTAQHVQTWSADSMWYHYSISVPCCSALHACIMNILYFKIGSVCLCAHLTLYPATDCAAATDISSVSSRWQLSRYSVRRVSR